MVVLLLLLFGVLKGINATSIKMAQRGYTRNTNESLYLTIWYSFIQLITLLLMPPYRPLVFSLEIMIYPTLYAIFFTAGYVLYINSLRTGPVSLTNVIYNFNSLIPIIVGVFLWGESITLVQWVGLILFGLILYLFNQSSYQDAQGTQSISGQWAIIAILASLFTGISVIFTKQHMVVYPAYIKEYLIIFNLVIVLAGTLHLSLAKKRLGIKFSFDWKFLAYVGTAGMAQNITNIIFMFYITSMKSARFFPLMGIINILSVVIFSRVVFQEKMASRAYVGIALSLLAIFLLSL